MNLFILFTLLSSVIETVINISIRDFKIKINNRYIYTIKIYKSLESIAEVQFSPIYGFDEKDIEFSEFKNIDVELSLESKQEIITIIFGDNDDLII